MKALRVLACLIALLGVVAVNLAFGAFRVVTVERWQKAVWCSLAVTAVAWAASGLLAALIVLGWLACILVLLAAFTE